MKPLKIMFFPGKISGGVGAVVMNIFRNIDHKKYHIDFCIPDADEGKYDEEIMASGSKIFHTPQMRKSGINEYYNTVIRVLKENGPYDAVHIHSVHMGAITLLASKKAGVINRYYHVHNTRDAALDGFHGHRIIERVLKSIICTNSTKWLACGKEAGEYIYGKNREFIVINNAIDPIKFHPDEENRRVLRNKLGIESHEIVVGNVARFAEEKNQKYFIELAKKNMEENGNLVFVMIGDGPQLSAVMNLAKNENVENRFKFIGNVNDTSMLYNIMDVFCLPSLFEGLPVTLIEAQACGLPCIVNSTVTMEAHIEGMFYEKIPADYDHVEKWISTIMIASKHRVTDELKILRALNRQKYDFKSMVKKIQLLYDECRN